MKKVVVILIFIGLGTVFAGILSSQKVFENKRTSEIEAVVYKSPSCSCCVNYIGYLKKEGFKVKVVSQENMNLIKNKYQIPKDMESCHTAVIGGYFIEGHVPVKAIDKLLTEKPAIEGISLPAMPGGSPGMPGFKREPFKVYQLLNGKASEYLIL
jgi:hypothetical protein